MPTTDTAAVQESRALQAAGLVLGPVLDTSDLCAPLKVKSRGAVLRIAWREGMPLARVGCKYLIARSTFLRWLDARGARALLRRDRSGKVRAGGRHCVPLRAPARDGRPSS